MIIFNLIYIICAIICYNITMKEGFGRFFSFWLCLGGPLSLIFVLLIHEDTK